MTDLDLSVLIATYRNDDPEHLRTALESVVEQTRPPDEVVLVQDGPLSPELGDVVEEFRAIHENLLTPVPLERNRGLGGALRAGVAAATNPWVARMDADDVSPPDRFERQLDFLAAHSEVDVVGGYIAEFDDDPEDPHARREVPTAHEDIARLARRRSPMNHASVVFRRDAVLDAGNYRPVESMEDWDLWSRLLLDGARLANVPEVLLYVRAGPAMYERRGGWSYAREEVRTQVEFVRRGFTGPAQFAFNLATRVPVRLLPNALRGQVYRRLFRS